MRRSTTRGCFLRRVAKASTLLPLWLGSFACSENFGPPPPGGGSRIAVVSQSAAGPVLPGAAISAAARGNRIWLGTGGGLFRADLGESQAAWAPAHGGFFDVNGVERIVPVQRVFTDADSPLTLHVNRSGGDLDTMTGSDDGGSTFFSLEAPNLLARSVLGAAVLPPSGLRARGAWLVAQGAEFYLREPSASMWSPVSVPAPPLEIGAIDGDQGGTVWAAVRVAAGWQLWKSEDAGASFVLDSQAIGGPVLALASAGQSVAWVDETALNLPTQTLPWADHQILAADLEWRGGSVAWAVLARRNGDAELLWATGRGLDAAILGVDAGPSPVAATLVLTDRGAVLAQANQQLRRLSGTSEQIFEFEGGDLNWGSLGVRPGTDRKLILGHGRTGNVYVGDSRDPSSMVSLGTPQFQSEARSVLSDPAGGEGVFAGSFGAFFNDGSDQIWQSRNAGQSNYLLILFAGPVSVQTLAAHPDGTLWLGAINGNGPYRSSDRGNFWTRAHGGLGQPGTVEGEDGLPSCTEVHAFCFSPEGTTWMGSFRGGVWRWDEPNLLWVQENEGLPDLMGAPVDTCCYETFEREIDVRDLVYLDDDSMLAATGWGVYRREAGDASWSESNFGLTNGDLFAFAVHPRRPEWVAVAGRGTRTAPDWLFFSRDRGRTWTPVDTALPARWADDIVWSKSTGAELVATLQAQGAWRMELSP